MKYLIFLASIVGIASALHPSNVKMPKIKFPTVTKDSSSALREKKFTSTVDYFSMFYFSDSSCSTPTEELGLLGINVPFGTAFFMNVEYITNCSPFFPLPSPIFHISYPFYTTNIRSLYVHW